MSGDHDYPPERCTAVTSYRHGHLLKQYRCIEDAKDYATFDNGLTRLCHAHYEARMARLSEEEADQDSQGRRVGMTHDETFLTLADFDEHARAQGQRGTIRVLSNCSSHFLVVEVPDNHDGQEPTHGHRLLAYPYYQNPEDWHVAYHLALEAMVRLVRAEEDM